MLRISVEKDRIVEVLSIANEIVPLRGMTSILANVYLSVSKSTLTVRSTNLSIGFETTLEIENGQDGTILVLCEKLISIIRNLPSGIIIIEQTDDSIIRISSTNQENIEYTLYFNVMNENYPEFTSAPQSGYSLFSQQEFRSMIHKTLFAVSQDESRRNISGLFLDRNKHAIISVGTDGRRLSYMEINDKTNNEILNLNDGIIIPTKILTLIEKYVQQGQIGLQLVNEKTLFINLYDYYFSTSLIDEQFPNYERVIPKQQQYHIEVNSTELSTAIKQVALLAEKTKRITFSIFKNTLIINSDQAEIGKAKIEIGCKYSGPDTKIAVNYSYILDPLKAMDENKKEVIIGFTENNRALSLYPKSESEEEQSQQEVHVIMPMQLD